MNRIISILALLFTASVFVMCTKECKECNSCIEKQIKSIKKESVWNPPASVWQYTYNGQKVYFIPQHSGDEESVLMDENCNIICHPDGGISGNGDGQCTDFFEKRTDGKLVWQDDRK